jgi:DNA-binding XRE family transcriptional regulator
MPVAEKSLPTIPKHHSGDLLIHASDRQGHRLQMFGCITPSVLNAIKKDYVIELEDTTYVEVTKTDWYAESQNRLRHGGLIRMLRNHINISQGTLGKRLNVTGKYVSDLESGRRSVSLKMAGKLAEVFGRKPERFLPLEP